MRSVKKCSASRNALRGEEKKDIFPFSLLWRTMSVGPTESRVIKIKINGSQTTRLTPAGPTGPFIHALTLSCTAEASLRTVYTANPSLHALREFAQGLNWGVTAGCNEVVEAVEADSACSATVCLRLPNQDPMLWHFSTTVLLTN